MWGKREPAGIHDEVEQKARARRVASCRDIRLEVGYGVLSLVACHDRLAEAERREVPLEALFEPPPPPKEHTEHTGPTSVSAMMATNFKKYRGREE